MRVLILTSLLVAGTAGFVRAGAEVKVTEGLVSIRTAAAPLADVLERLQEQTGMKVIYDGPRPQQTVAVTIEDQPLTAAISTLLDAQGIKYAVAMNAAGTKVATLLITTTSSAPRASAHPAEAPPSAPPFPGEDSSYAMPPMPPMSPPGMGMGMEGAPMPPATMPASAPPTTMTVGPSVSPFTPQGPGPILIPPPGSAAPTSGSATIATPPPAAPPPLMTPLPGPSTAERPPWEK